jgi:ATP-binding cassette subfamily B protein
VDPTEGALRIDGVDLRELDPDELRRHVGLVAQGVHLLPGTVAENIGARSPADATRLLAAVGLDGLLSPDDLVGEGGRALSRGEAQLVCVARALAGDPELLVLDEATAAMDPDTEARVTALARGRSVLAVAHRLRLVVNYDEIHVVSEGRIVESGDHPTLLARGGVYAGLWRAQLAGEG